LLYDGPLLCGFNVAIKGLSNTWLSGDLSNAGAVGAKSQIFPADGSERIIRRVLMRTDWVAGMLTSCCNFAYGCFT